MKKEIKGEIKETEYYEESKTPEYYEESKTPEYYCEKCSRKATTIQKSGSTNILYLSRGGKLVCGRCVAEQGISLMFYGKAVIVKREDKLINLYDGNVSNGEHFENLRFAKKKLIDNLDHKITSKDIENLLGTK